MTWFKSAIFGFIVMIAVYLLPISQPALHLDVLSNVSGATQIFYKLENGSYTNKYTAVSSISLDRKVLEFGLPYFNDPVRWDPVDAPFSLVIYRAWVSVFGVNVPIDPHAIAGGRHIDSVRVEADSVRVSTIKDAFDPQINFSVNSGRIQELRLIFCLVAGVLAALIAVLLSIFRIEIRVMLERIESLFININKVLVAENFNLREFGIFFGIAALLHIYELSVFSLSIDDEYGAYREFPSVWIADGRWVSYLIERFILPQPVMPFVPNLIFCALIALSYMLVIRAHRLSVDWRVYISYPIFCAFPTWWFISEFYSNLPSAAIGTFMVSLSIFLFSRIESELGSYRPTLLFKTSLAPALALAIALGSYQAFLMMYIAMGVGIVLLTNANMVEFDRVGHKIERIFRLAFVAWLGLIIYLAINRLANYFSPTGYDYIGSFWRIHDFLNDPIGVFRLVVLEMLSIYSGSSEKFGVSIYWFGFLAIFSVAVILQGKSLKDACIAFSLWLALVSSPFLLHFLTGAVYLPMRSMLSIAYVAWLMVILVLGARRFVSIVVAALLVFLLELQMIAVSGQYAASSFVAQAHDRMLAADIYRRMGESNPKFDRSNRIVVDVYGSKSIDTIFPSPPSSTMRASFFDWDGGNLSRMLTFMKLLGYSNVSAASPQKRKELSSQFTEMPAWPASGSVKYSDGIYLVKLSQKPDPIHRK